MNSFSVVTIDGHDQDRAVLITNIIISITIDFYLSTSPHQLHDPSYALLHTVIDDDKMMS